MTVQITFQPPSRDDSTSCTPIHKRTLQGVPRPVAKEITEDLRTYQSNPSSTNPWKLYRYQKIGEETQGEVVAGQPVVIKVIELLRSGFVESIGSTDHDSDNPYLP